jgi:CRISPR/Cas system CSM-associated protein Csm3 (group 7 of RAMP superfamily)
VLVKDEIIRLPNEPDSINIKNNKGDYIIPGSSLKGIIRSRAERLQMMLYNNT